MLSVALDLNNWNYAEETTHADDRQRRFEQLVNEYSDPLYRYAYWHCHNRATAQDLVQETFLRAWKSLDSLKDRKAAKGWLFTILRRENARQYERVQPEWSDTEVDALSSPATGYDTSTEAFVLRQALAALPEQYREPLLMQVIGGFDYDEIAKQLQLSKGAVTSRLFRARQKLHRALSGG